MEHFDWQMFLFVGTSLAHDVWVHWGFPQIYYWELRRDSLKSINTKNNGKKI